MSYNILHSSPNSCSAVTIAFLIMTWDFDEIIKSQHWFLMLGLNPD